MSIPFRLSDEIETLGEAVFLQLESSSDRAMRGALLFLNALGEPKEFVYNRIRLDAADALWRPGDREPGAARRLIASLFDAAQGTPHLLFCRADAVAPELFGDSREHNGTAALLTLGIPMARLAPARGDTSTVETIDTFDARGDALILTADWASPPGPPAFDSPGAALLALLAVRGLLWEPFERAATGLREAYGV